MCGVYRIFSRDWKDICDYSDECMRELNMHESIDGRRCQWNNGYYIGKKYLNLNVNMWKEDIKYGTLFKYELYEDGTYPTWWLDNIFKKLE
jgi:hypothetical protein